MMSSTVVTRVAPFCLPQMLLQLVSLLVIFVVLFSVLPTFVQTIRPYWRWIKEEIAFYLYALKDFQMQLRHLVIVMYSYDVYYYDFTGNNLYPESVIEKPH